MSRVSVEEDAEYAGPTTDSPNYPSISDEYQTPSIESSIEEAESVAFVLHDDPDPDALSSGFAGYKLAEKYGKDAAIFHGEDISHQPNQEFADELEIPNEPYAEAKESIRDYDQTYLIDNNGGNTSALQEFFNDSQEDFNSLITGIIDHHQDNAEKSEFPNLPENNKWVEEDAGSTATLMTEVLDHDNYFDSREVDSESKEHVAAALMRGIETDTYDLDDATQRDKSAYETLEQAVNSEKIYKELLDLERQYQEDIEYSSQFEVDVNTPETPVDYLKFFEVDSNGKDDIWKAANKEIKNAQNNTAVIAYDEAENGSGSGIKLSGRARLENKEMSDYFDIEEFLTESPVLHEARENNSLGGKQIRKVHEAGGWIPDKSVDEFRSEMADFADEIGVVDSNNIEIEPQMNHLQQSNQLFMRRKHRVF